MRYLTVTDSDIIESVGFTIDIIDDVGSQSSALGNGVLQRAKRDRGFGTLAVVFKSSPNDVYEYKDVSAVTFAMLISAESVGKAFHDTFRKTKHPFTKSIRSGR